MSKTQPQNPPTSLARDKLGLPSSKTEDQEVVTNCSKGGGSRPSWPSHALSSVFCSPTTPGGGEKGSNAWNCPSSPFFSVVHPSILHRRGVGTSVEGKRRKKKKASCIAGLRVTSQRPLNPVPFLACPPASPVRCTDQNLDEYRARETSGSSSRATRHFRFHVHPSYPH